MTEYESELQTAKRSEEEQQGRGVVVCLSSHRRWRPSSPRKSEGSASSEGEVAAIVEEATFKALQPVMEATTETPIREPSFWLPGLVALMSFAAVIGFYCVLLEMIKSIIYSIPF
ncbi:MAG: hypothetical protein KJ947_25635 [Alphaproteobacteria bacterium]|nr:hypothetical protein [Alphaproteobacteria bacterium]MBU1552932.1 hypothetical protein [Alphaproteobacteria bacterium]MBU2337235.1 hypothetical protein [Alphaproteobacteria bacterium]MBU2388910.1 hypothetical protein [Alphaproteobacteria bacterium]